MLLTPGRREADHLRAGVEARQLLISGGREAVDTASETANPAGTEGLGAALRCAIEQLADWAELEQPDLAQAMTDGSVVILFSDIADSTRAEREDG